MHAIDVVSSYQDTCSWGDNKMLSLLCEFIDSKKLAGELQGALEQALLDDTPNYLKPLLMESKP